MWDCAAAAIFDKDVVLAIMEKEKDKNLSRMLRASLRDIILRFDEIEVYLITITNIAISDSKNHVKPEVIDIDPIGFVENCKDKSVDFLIGIADTLEDMIARNNDELRFLSAHQKAYLHHIVGSNNSVQKITRQLKQLSEELVAVKSGQDSNVNKLVQSISELLHDIVQKLHQEESDSTKNRRIVLDNSLHTELNEYREVFKKESTDVLAVSTHIPDVSTR